MDPSEVYTTIVQALGGGVLVGCLVVFASVIR